MSYKSYEKKAFILSIFLHSALFGSYFLYTKPEVVETKSSSPAIAMQLSSFELPKKNLEKPIENKPKERPKKEHKPEKKIVKKQKVKPKPVEKQIVKKEAILPKKKPIKKEIETVQEVVEKQEIIKPENTEVAIAQEIQKKESIQEKLRLEKEQQAKMAQQQFMQTNFDIIRNKVFSHLIYPNTAKRMGWTGVIELALVIDSNGKLIDISIHKSSNKKMLDEAAIKAAKKIQKEQLPKPQITSTIILPIAFKLS
jgi:protein TonB